jgi:hypothetical protein
MRQLGAWRVRIISIEADRRGAMVSWNGNAPQRYSKAMVERLYRKLTPKQEARIKSQR